ncbi:hypothetical protein BHE74_00030901 [Ensete ventricosum]|nr:hypothetical protein BHE74_00030901 [Ensete ventricosum]
MPKAVGLAGVSSRSKDDAVGNLLRVHRKLTEVIRSLPGWCKGVHRKKIETHSKIVTEKLVGVGKVLKWIC